ncbi:von Willebrand factor type A domain protein [compost metagenome]
MKSIRLLLAAFCCMPLVYSQTNYHLQVVNNQNQPAGNLSVRFVESKTFERIEKKTNAAGILDLVFDHGELWIGSVGEMNNCLWVEAWGKGTASGHITYDLEVWERENRILPDRSTIVFKKTPQKYPSMPRPDATHCALKVVVKNREDRPQANIPVTLTCFALAEQFTGTTNAGGECIFLVPNKNDYEIDVADIPSMDWADFGNESMGRTAFLTYEKKAFTEKKEGKYTVQTIPAGTKPSSSHAQVDLTIRKGGAPIANEPVYLKTVGGSIKYKGKTDAKGKVVFMLPLKTKYVVDFTFQRDAGVLDLSRMKGFATMSRTINYLPDPRLENIESFIPRVKDLVDLNVNDFVTAQYPSGENDVDLFLKWGNKFNASSKEAVLEVGFKVNGKNKKSPIPKNLLLVIDVSGSMSNDNRLELLKKTLIELINRMTSQDRIGIVAFDDQLYKVLPSQFITNKAAICDIIRALQPMGGTNISIGFEEGLKQLEANKKPNMVNRLILLSDGYGGDDPGISINLAKTYAAKGLQISAIGVGYDYNAALLEQLATIGGGSLQMAGDPSHYSQAFLKTFEGFTDPIGTDVKLEILFNDQIVYRQLLGYENAKVNAGKVTVDIDHLFPGLQKMALVKMDIINSTPSIEQQKVVARMTYTDPGSKKQKTVEKELKPEWSPATGLLDMTLDMNHKRMMTVAIVNQSMKLMAEKFASGDKSGSEKAAKNGIAQIQKLFPQAIPADLKGLFEKLEEYVSVFEQLRAEP